MLEVQITNGGIQIYRFSSSRFFPSVYLYFLSVICTSSVSITKKQTRHVSVSLLGLQIDTFRTSGAERTILEIPCVEVETSHFIQRNILKS